MGHPPGRSYGVTYCVLEYSDACIYQAGRGTEHTTPSRAENSRTSSAFAQDIDKLPVDSVRCLYPQMLACRGQHLVISSTTEG